MKPSDFRSIESILKEYSMKPGKSSPTPVKDLGLTKAKQTANQQKSNFSKGASFANASSGKGGNFFPSSSKSIATGNQPKVYKPVKAKELELDDQFADKDGKPLKVVSPYKSISTPNPNDVEDIVLVQDPDQKNDPMALDPETEIQVEEGRLSKIASRKGKKLKIKDLKGKIKKLSRKRLKEADPKLFEINFNRTSIAKEALDAPVKCGFEAETFFYSVDSRGPDVDEMSINDIEYEYGDMPDQVWEDFEDWLYSKGQDEYLDDIIDDKVNEVREDEDYLNDFIDSGAGPSSEAIERYKKDFEEQDPKEYENREEDGWEYMNWVREYVEEEYEEEYLDWLRDNVREDNDLDDDAREAARSDYSVEDWIYDNYSYISSFLDDYGYEYGGGSSGDVEGVADELHTWIRDNSEFDSYPESGDYGDTNTTTAWSVEPDSSIEPDEGTGAELISPVFSSPRKMLSEMRSLFDWSETNFGTNHSTGLHVTMSWHGEPDAPRGDDGRMQGQEPNKLKMALLLGDEYLLAEFNRLRNSYSKSQYRSVLKYAEGMKRGDAKSFKQFEEMLSKGIDTGKFNSIHFKGEADTDSGNKLIEFRIAGGTDYNTMYEKVVKACVRYATIMKAGYEEDAFRKDYVNAVFRLLRKSQEIDPKKLKDLEVVNHEVIDSAKSIVGKKDYFDVIKLLSTSVEYLQGYKELSDPDADKQWKQSIKDYEKGTGDKVEVDEAEEREPIQGYIKPNSMAPSKRAAGELDKAKDRFGSAITLLARDIADGNNRAPVSAKHIGSFRKFAKELQLNTDTIEKLALSGMDNYNFDGTDKEKVARLQKGINSLFKQDIIKKPEYLAIKDVDAIGSKLWQFYQSDDAKDNGKMDKLADLLVNLSPSNNKTDIEDLLRDLSQQRSENGFFAKLKGGGWSTRTVLLKNNGITTKGSAEQLLKFLEPYGGYKHPTSPDHHVNIKSDDRYTEVFQMRLTQRLRARLDHLKDLEVEDNEKYITIAKQVSKLGIELLEALKPEELEPYDGQNYLASHNTPDRWNDVMDRLVKADSEIGTDELTFNFPALIDDYVLASINLDNYYREKDLGTTVKPEQKLLIKKRFAAIKTFLSAFDKIFQKEGFVNLKQEIKAKNTLDKRNKDFEKNVRDNAKAKLNIPSHSWVYIDKDFFDTITDEDYDDRAAYLDSHLEHFNKQLNNTKVYVIPSSHFSDAEDATNGLELIDTFEKNKNYYHTWRKKGYKKILNRFTRIYGYNWENLIDPDKFIQGDGDVYQKLQGLGIEITHKGDSRKGAPGQEDLFPEEETRNPKSGEPLNRSSGMSWENMDDDAEQKRFDAFDWDQYPAKMKDVVAKEMANKESSFGSFKVALDNILKKVLDGDVGIDKDDLGKPIDKLAIAAGHDPDSGGSSNGIASETDWGNLADHLGIERGVNDQGVNLLRKVYQQFDGDHNWRPAETDENGNNVIGLQRWAAAVREAEKYIRDNYNVSGGNYFRKNVDGSDGDDVSGMYSDNSTTPHYTSDSAYDKARADHPGFDRMMQRGMQNYLARGEVNHLVGFLNNPDNDNVFKSQVLNTITNRGDMENGPFASFQDALAVTRRQGNESVLQKFDALSLQEQLNVLENLDNSKLDKVYETIEAQQDLSSLLNGINTDLKQRKKDAKKLAKKSVYERPLTKDEKKDKENFVKGMKKNTKDFNKRYGKDAKAVMYATATKMAKESVTENVSEGPSSKALPDNSIPGLLNDILSQPFPAWDLKKQFLAYYAVPDPQMLSDFRHHRSHHGDNACLRGILRFYIQKQLDPRVQDKINLNEHSKSRVKQIISESRGLYGRLSGDKFKKQETEIEFQTITNYPEIGKFEDADKRDEAIEQLESQLGSQIEWMNIPNKGSLGFAIATFTNTQNNANMYWGRYFREITPNMMGKWSNKEVPAGWQLQHNTALKMEAGLDPQHLIATGKWIGNTNEVINLVKENGGDNPVVPKLISALEQLSNGSMPNFESEREQLPAIRDYFGEIMGPVAFRGGLDNNGQSEIARNELLDGANWNDCQIRWPQEMNYALVDSIFKGPNGAEVGISSKGGKGASAGVTNIAKAMARASDELLQTHSKAVEIINIINDNSALNGPFRLAEYLGFLPVGLEEEINSYIKQVKKDFKGISKGANELISGTYGELQDPSKVPGFNTGFALMSKLAKKITMHINTNIPEFSDGCLAFLNQSAIVQLYCKMGVKGSDTFVAEWKSVYPPTFEGRILLDSGKTYYSSRIGSKFSFKFS